MTTTKQATNGNGKVSTEDIKKIMRISLRKGKLLSWLELTNGEYKEPEWVLKDLIAKGSVVTMFGSGGTKKTYIAIDLAVCLQIKKEWLGFKICDNSSVLFVDEESGKNRLAQRMYEAKNGYGVKGELNIYAICMARYSLRDASDANELKQYIKETGSKFLFIDSLVTVLCGDDNSSKEITQLYTNLRTIATELNIVIVIIHHANKLEGYRGSTAIRDQSDLLIQVTSKSTSPNIDFKTDKERDIAHVEWAAVSYLEKGKKFYLTSSVKKLTKLGSVQEYILRYTNEYTRVSVKDLENNCSKKISVISIRGTIYKMVDMGYLEPSGKEGKLAMFSLSDMGNNYVDTYLSTPLESYLNNM